MWRMLLARLHPDAGGDSDLFAFACAVREEVYGAKRPEREPTRKGEQEVKHPPAPFLRAWQHTMNLWASNNRDALRRL